MGSNPTVRTSMKMGNLQLRRFSLFDLNEVMEIEKTSFPKSQAYSRAYFEKHYQKLPQGFLVAERRGEIVGYIIGNLKKNLLELVSLAVRLEWRQKGIGTKLTKFLVSVFKGKGAKKFLLNVRTRNRTAISFYRNLGFETLRKVKNYYQNGDNAFLMKREV